MINTTKSYNEILRSARPTKLPKEIKQPPKGSLGAPTILPSVIIPPLNTDIDFSFLPQMNVTRVGGEIAARAARGLSPAMPENFSWYDESSQSESQSTVLKKKNMTPVMNQMLCGSCWAFAGASCISNTLVISGVARTNPQASPTFCLICYGQGQCQGGNPALLFQNVADSGIASEHCVDYSWCANNDKCNGAGTGHFDASFNTSSLLPSNCGCIKGGESEEHYLFTISPNIQSLFVGNSDPAVFQKVVRTNIYTRGTLVAGYPVLSNFMRGTFTKINGGVYLERGNYDTATSELTFSDANTDVSTQLKGFHAVEVVGWGLAKNILIDNGGIRADVPYYVVKNSWGAGWGDRGFFKMACYPFNKIAQFDQIITVSTESGQARIGGMLSILASDIPPKKIKFPKLNLPTGVELLRSDDYYNKDTDAFTPIPLTPEKKEKESSEPKIARKIVSVFDFVIDKQHYVALIVLLIFLILHKL